MIRVANPIREDMSVLNLHIALIALKISPWEVAAVDLGPKCVIKSGCDRHLLFTTLCSELVFDADNDLYFLKVLSLWLLHSIDAL
jgi:hypothetical protein